MVAVGGTALNVSGSSNSTYAWQSETVWGDGTSSGEDAYNGTGEDGGGGGGVSNYETQPTYQAGVVSTALATNEGAYTTDQRTYPDVSAEAAPAHLTCQTRV